MREHLDHGDGVRDENRPLGDALKICHFQKRSPLRPKFGEQFDFVVAEMMRGLRGNPAKLEECARNGRAFAARFEEGRVLGEFEKLLKELTEPKRIGSAAANT